MIQKEFIINNSTGLDSKPAALFIKKASNYKSSIWIEKDERKANAKSLLGLLSLSIGNGSKIVLSAEGEDAEQAVSDLVEHLSVNAQERI
jgi:phosphotransferase system HPr (HPr) family protein